MCKHYIIITKFPARRISQIFHILKINKMIIIIIIIIVLFAPFNDNDNFIKEHNKRV